LRASLKAKLPAAPFYFLPEPCPEFRGPDKAQARERLGLPGKARIFLFYGGPYKRKGLDLAVAAMLALPPSSRAFLFCVGVQPSDAAIARGLERLNRMQRAHSINHFVLDYEEELSFAACDAVLLPYRKHFGSSAVLARAAAAGKPVIASDEELIGRRVREHNLGPLFPSGSVAALRDCLAQITDLPDDQLAQWSPWAKKYARSCSPEAFRCALLEAFDRSHC
jgi:glycosyltransferase involved in cell wall biosynthesis